MRPYIPPGENPSGCKIKRPKYKVTVTYSFCRRYTIRELYKSSPANVHNNYHPGYMTARTKDQCKYNSCFVKGNLDNIKQSILTGQISS